KAPQNSVHQTRGARLPQNSRRIDSRMNAGLRCVARVLDLVRGRDEEGPDFARYTLGSFQQGFDCRQESQIPTDAAERDGADGGALCRASRGIQCVLKRTTLMRDTAQHAGGICQDVRTRRPLLASFMWSRA